MEGMTLQTLDLDAFLASNATVQTVEQCDESLLGTGTEVDTCTCLTYKSDESGLDAL